MFLTVIGLAGIVGGVLFSIEAPRFTPVPLVFLTFWLVMVIVGRILFTGLDKLRHSGANTPTSEQARAAAAVAGIVIAVGMIGFTATTAGSGTAAAAPCPGGGPATCGPTGPDLTFAPPTGQATAPGQQPGQQGGQDNNGIATSPAKGGDNGPGIQAQTPEFGTPGQQAPNIPGNEQPGQGGGQQQGQQPQGNGQRQQNQNPAVQTTAPGGPQQTGQQQPGQQPQSGQPSTATVTVTTTQSECPMPGAPGANGGAPGAPGADGNDSGGVDSDDENKDGPSSWAYLVGEATGIMAGGRTRRRPTPGAVASQLSSETLTDTTAVTKTSSEYYSSAQINPSPSTPEAFEPNTADAPPAHQPQQPPSTGSGSSGSGPSPSPSPSTSGGQGESVGSSPGRGVGTGSGSGSTPTPMPGSAGDSITPTNFGGPDGEGYPQPGGVPGIFSFLWPLVNALAKFFQDIYNRLIKPFLDWIAEIIRSINKYLIGLPGLIAILPDILRKYLEGIVGLIRGPERGMAPPTTGNPGTTAPTSPGDGEGGGNGDGNKPPKPTPPIVLPPGQNPGTDLPTPADPGTPLPGQPRPPITPKPTTPPDPGKIPAPGRIDPETGLPVIPQQPRPSTTPQPGTGSTPSASNGGQAPKPKKQPPAPTKPPPKPGNGGGPGKWERTNESGGANAEQNRPFQETVTGVDGAWSYVVNGVKFDGFEILKGILKVLVDAKFGSSGYGALLKPDGTLVDVSSPNTPPFVKGIYDSLVSEIQRQIAAVNALPNPQNFPIYWVANSPTTAAALKAVLDQVPEAAGRITVVTVDVWNALKGIK
ncbi:hypothetical protein FK268_18470 [Tsukamurella sputi]|uniref:Tox-REase-5 domain-containing protein n=1 Tax=Tsukamurella sputi TaxID=2591848 RepID=A0A5C5RJC5_9ACTN|nr:hypothetical protein [Tsukamurella sputi]TWS22712.1 hypothetical protein FK268_18470 [Tsukamurella sputi]